MNRGWFIVLAVLVGLNAALLYDKFARQGPPAPEPGRGRPAQGEGSWGDMDPRERGERMLERHLERMTRQLGLDETQRERIREIKASSFDELSTLRESTRDTRHEIRRLLQAADLDSARIRELSASLHDGIARLESLATENFIREAAVLTPEQREKYLQRRSFGPRGRGEGRGGRRGPRHPPGDGPPSDSPPPDVDGR